MLKWLQPGARAACRRFCQAVIPQHSPCPGTPLLRRLRQQSRSCGDFNARFYAFFTPSAAFALETLRPAFLCWAPVNIAVLRGDIGMNWLLLMVVIGLLLMLADAMVRPERY